MASNEFGVRDAAIGAAYEMYPDRESFEQAGLRAVAVRDGARLLANIGILVDRLTTFIELGLSEGEIDGMLWNTCERNQEDV